MENPHFFSSPEPHPLGQMIQSADFKGNLGLAPTQLRSLDCFALVYVYRGFGRSKMFYQVYTGVIYSISYAGV